MAPKSAKAAAPAPAPVEETAEFVIDIGTKVQFLGYGPDVPEDERLIEAGTILEIRAIGDENDDNALFVAIPNPDFNPKRKESATNSKLIEVQVMDEEIGPVEEGAVEEVTDVEPETVEETPPPATTKRATTKTAGKGKGKAAAETAAPAKGKGKAAQASAKAAGKKTAAKKVAEQQAEVEERLDPEALPDLETEDETVRTMVDERVGELTALAQELEQQAATSEYQLGGVLYHLKKSGEYKTLDDGAYDVEGGWKLFMESYFNTQYRKGQYLIEIYVAFSQKGIEDAGTVVAAMGWSKAAKIAKPMLEAEDDELVDQLIADANSNTVEDLSTIIKERKTEGGTAGTGGEKVTKLSIKFRLVEDDAVTANAILSAAQEQLGVKDVGDAFMQILIDWNNDHGAVGAAAETETETAAQAAPAPRKTAGRRAQTA